MAAAVAKLGREKSISTLAQRVYVIEGRNNTDAQRRAERALLRANPSLSDKKAFRTGRVIIVPSDVGLATTERVTKTTADLDGALDETKLRMELAAQMLEEQFERSGASDKATTDRLADKALIKQVRTAIPGSTKILAKTAAAVKDRTAKSSQRKSRYDKAFKQAFTEIDRLKKLAGKG
ncbi:hypothetical protein [Pelagibius sp. Alg239-R121]|uniref:hypothetical protein n=1 Tax=Pelagibius sp. Alg239-R121 TaxID=2993448 RepID=UPI0024A74FC5|nr:hypothetical protein [Pelagibius sp. Alg239-R121]